MFGFVLVFVCRVLCIFLEMNFNVLFKVLKRGSNSVIEGLFLVKFFLFCVDVMLMKMEMRILIKFWLYNKEMLIFLVEIK